MNTSGSFSMRRLHLSQLPALDCAPEPSCGATGLLLLPLLPTPLSEEPASANDGVVLDAMLLNPFRRGATWARVRVVRVRLLRLLAG
jgi:hypothetical protein